MFKDDKDHETQYCHNCYELQTQLEAKIAECERLLKQDTEKNDIIISQFNTISKLTNSLKKLTNSLNKILNCREGLPTAKRIAYETLKGMNNE